MIQSTAVTPGHSTRARLRSSCPSPMDRPAERRRRLTHRALPVVGGLALVSLVVGIVAGAGADSAAMGAARRYGAAWERGDYRAMYALLGADSKSRVSPARFEAAYRTTAATATATAVKVGSPGGESDGTVRLPVTVRTRIFGTVRGDVDLPVSDDRVELAPGIVFPGVGP